MTGRERLLEAARGAALDPKPVIGFPHCGIEIDGYVDVADQLHLAPAGAAKLAFVRSPFGEAAMDGIDLNARLSQDLEGGHEALNTYFAKVEAEIQRAAEANADGIFYSLAGAEPAASTPMQYGGFYLELDRELLSKAGTLPLNVLWIEGKTEPFLDSVVDLPAPFFGYFIAETGVNPDVIRADRPGPIVSNVFEADVSLAFNADDALALTRFSKMVQSNS